MFSLQALTNTKTFTEFFHGGEGGANKCMSWRRLSVAQKYHVKNVLRS